MAVIKNFIKTILCLLIILIFTLNIFAQNLEQYKKKVLEKTEIDFLMSYYKQSGTHSSVGGGLGTEKLDNITPTIVISIPLNDNDILKIDAGLSSYTSASSSNINPFTGTGASKNGDDHDDDDDDYEDDDDDDIMTPTGTPWLSSSGASKSDELSTINISYNHSSSNRNFIWGSQASFSQEYDYNSIGFGGNTNFLFNEQNTEFGLKFQVYLDKWKPIYPTELKEFDRFGNDLLYNGFFDGVEIINRTGGSYPYYFPDKFKKIKNTNRNSYSASLFFSQILTPKMQFAVFSDIVYQEGLLSTPYHRIYFKDFENYYVGEIEDIDIYTKQQNKTTFHLADDIERLPNRRLKLPIGTRLNYYINDLLILRTYYRYYNDDWNINSHTVQLELPIKLIPSFTIAPMYRYYSQTASKYFAPYNEHLSTQKYYTSDYDLSEFNSSQYGIRMQYTDIFSRISFSRFRLKNINLRYNNYQRSDGLSANIITFAIKLIVD